MFLFALAACAPSWFDPPADEAVLEAQLEDMVEEHTRAFGYSPAVAFAIVVDGAPVARVASGVERPDWDIPVDGATALPLSSVTEVLTTFAVMKLVEEGAFGLDDAVGALVPDAPTAVAGITVEQLLRRTDGLADADLSPDYARLGPDARTALPPAAYVASAASLPPRFPPGERAEAGRTGMVLASWIVASTMGTSYAEHLQGAILDPVGMSGTGFANDVTPWFGVSGEVYERDGDGFLVTPRPYAGADLATGALMSTLDDQVAWMSAIQLDEVVTHATWDTMTDGAEAARGRALGLAWGRRRGYELVGVSDGQSVVFALTPDGRAGAVFLSNSADPRLADLGYEVAVKAAQWAETR